MTADVVSSSATRVVLLDLVFFSFFLSPVDCFSILFYRKVLFMIVVGDADCGVFLPVFSLPLWHMYD